jgi:tyrosinase
LRIGARNPNRRTPDLTPFWKSGSAFHRSTDDPVKNFIKFRSTYPEFVGLDGLPPDQLKAKIQEKVDALYDPNSRRLGIPVGPASALAAAGAAGAAAVARVAQAPQAVLQAAAPVTLAAFATPPAQATAAQAHPPAAQAHPPAPAPAHTHGATAHLTALQRLDWFARIRVKKYQFKQSFTVFIFLGPVPNHVAQWRSSPNLAGSHSEFVNSDPEHCANCMENADIITEGFIALDDDLERKGFTNQSEAEIEKYISDNIHWRIQLVSRRHHHCLSLGD